MKKNSWLFGLVVCLLAFGFLLTGCDSGGDSGGSGGGSAELTFSNEQVYTVNDSDTDITFTPYTGSMAVTSNVGGSGSITNGKFSFTVGEPAYLEGSSDYLGYDFPTGASVSPADAQAARLFMNNNKLEKGDGSMSGSNITQENVSYYYFDKNCTITIPAQSENGVTSQTTNLNLKQGWNAVCSKIMGSMATMTGTIEFKTVDFSYGKWVTTN